MKYFTNSYLNDYNILKNAKIGLEFEFYSKLTYGNTLEILNRKLDKKVYGFKEYHPDFTPNENEWMITPDFSAGINCVELITHPMDYSEARIMLVKIYKIIQEIGYTSERTGIHINISFNNKFLNIESINPIKLTLAINEEYIYTLFPERKNNIYCKSIKNIIPFKNYDFSVATANIMSSSLFLHSGISKYYGVNFTCLNKGRIEFRYLGGENYENSIDESLELLDYFVKLCYTSTKEEITPSETKMLRRYLETNISKYKDLSDINNFIAKYPSISLEVDRTPQIEIIKSYYPQLFDQLFDTISQISDLKQCKINYDTDNQKIEIVDATFVSDAFISNTIFIDCTISGGDFTNCEFFKTELINTIINQSTLNDSKIKDSKILESKVLSHSEILESYLSDSYLDCYMESGIFRNSILGENGEVGDLVRMMNDKENFFNLNTSDINNKKKGDLVINKKEGK